MSPSRRDRHAYQGHALHRLRPCRGRSAGAGRVPREERTDRGHQRPAEPRRQARRRPGHLDLRPTDSTPATSRRNRRATIGTRAGARTGAGSSSSSNTGTGGDYEVFVMDADGSGRRQITFNELDEDRPGWSPDGRLHRVRSLVRRRRLRHPDHPGRRRGRDQPDEQSRHHGPPAVLVAGRARDRVQSRRPHGPVREPVDRDAGRQAPAAVHVREHRRGGPGVVPGRSQDRVQQRRRGRLRPVGDARIRRRGPGEPQQRPGQRRWGRGVVTRRAQAAVREQPRRRRQPRRRGSRPLQDARRRQPPTQHHARRALRDVPRLAAARVARARRGDDD